MSKTQGRVLKPGSSLVSLKADGIGVEPPFVLFYSQSIARVRFQILGFKKVEGLVKAEKTI